VIEEKLDFLAVVRDDDIADAIPAQLGAERDMKIEVQRIVGLYKRLQGFGMEFRSEVLRPVI
jgi:hypothetical protein